MPEIQSNGRAVGQSRGAGSETESIGAAVRARTLEVSGVRDDSRSRLEGFQLVNHVLRGLWSSCRWVDSSREPAPAGVLLAPGSAVSRTRVDCILNDER